MRDTARLRRLASCTSLVAGPALILAATVTLPWYTGDDTSSTLALAADHPDATRAGDLLAFLGILAMIPATLAVMRLLRRRAPLLGLAGGALSVAGWIGAMLLVIANEYDLMLAGSPAREEVATTLQDSSPWVLGVVLAVFLIGINLGALVLGAGLIRGHVVPVWAGIAVVASPVLGVLAHAADVKALDIAGGVVLLAGFAALARLVAASSDEAWERGEPASPARAEAPLAT
jgi:hypothetical protein